MTDQDIPRRNRSDARTLCYRAERRPIWPSRFDSLRQHFPVTNRRLVLPAHNVDERERAAVVQRLIDLKVLDKPIVTELPLDRIGIVEVHLHAGMDLIPVVSEPRSLAVHRSVFRDDGEDHGTTGCELLPAISDELCTPVGIEQIDEPVTEDPIVLASIERHVRHRAVVNGNIQTQL